MLYYSLGGGGCDWGFASRVVVPFADACVAVYCWTRILLVIQGLVAQR